MSSLLVVDENSRTIYITDGKTATVVANQSTTPRPGDDPYAWNPIQAVADGTAVYLIMADTTGQTSALYRYDGTRITQLTTATDYVSSTTDRNQIGGNSMVSYNGSIIFSMESVNDLQHQGLSQTALTKLDTTTGAISAIAVPNGGGQAFGFTQLADKLYFIGNDSTTNQKALYVYDGTTASEINTGQTLDGAIAAFNGKIYFGNTSDSVCQYDPSNGTTSTIIPPDQNSSVVDNFILFNNNLIVDVQSSGFYSINANDNVSKLVGIDNYSVFTPAIYNNSLYYIAYHQVSASGYVQALYQSTDGINSTLIRDNTSADGLTVANGVLNFLDKSTGQVVTYNGTSFSTNPLPTFSNSFQGGALTAVPFDVPSASFPEDRTAVTFTAKGETVYAIGANSGTLQIIDASNGNAVLDQQTLTGDFTKGLFALAADGGSGTTISFNADPSLGFAQGHVILANIVGQSASAYQDADAAGEFIGTGAATTTIAGALVLGGGVAVTNAQTVVQTGTVQIGDANGAAASLTNAAGGDYQLSGDVGLTLGTGSPVSSFVNVGGILEKTAGTGVSIIAVNVNVTGSTQHGWELRLTRFGG